MKLLIILLFSVASAQDFDTIAFVQKWPLCKDKDCPIKDKGDERFLIDQILPFNRNSGEVVSECGPEEHFHMEEITDLTEELTYAWPNWPEPEGDDNLWAKDWKLHGSCLKQYISWHENGYFKQALEWYTQNNITKSLTEKRMYPGLPLFPGRLLSSIDKCAINCQEDKSTWKSPVLSHVAICYDVLDMTQVECGQLFGGKQGTCPQYGMVWWLHSKAEDRSTDNAGDDSPDIILMNNNPTLSSNNQDKFMLGTSVGMMVMAGLLCLFSVLTVFYITKMSSNKKDKSLV